jgi:hypothetical protein
VYTTRNMKCIHNRCTEYLKAPTRRTDVDSDAICSVSRVLYEASRIKNGKPDSKVHICCLVPEGSTALTEVCFLFLV